MNKYKYYTHCIGVLRLIICIIHCLVPKFPHDLLGNQFIRFVSRVILIPKHILASVGAKRRQRSTCQSRPNLSNRATRAIRIVEACITIQ